jgi:hypothetical protein
MPEKFNVKKTQQKATAMPEKFNFKKAQQNEV